MKNPNRKKIVDALLKLDFSKQLSLREIDEKVSKQVSMFIGARDGGNINIARGRVILPQEMLERRNKVLAFQS